MFTLQLLCLLNHSKEGEILPLAPTINDEKCFNRVIPNLKCMFFHKLGEEKKKCTQMYVLKR